MHKDELIQLHTLLCQVKNYFEVKDQSAAARFADYEQFGVAPQHIHKSKMQHKKAVFLLGKELAEMIMEEAPKGPHGNRVVERFNRLAARASGEGLDARREVGVLTVP